ncbi:MAG: DUF3303 domain-containing protein [Acidobacteria bacterium]|nr:DUF3303 domain-containing protein [Acidobacteriota bacterium]
MKFMVTWEIFPGCYEAAAERFLGSGGPTPKGVKSIARWHGPGSTVGWHIVESNDPRALAEDSAEWADLLDMQVTPVLDDADAAKVMGKRFGKKSRKK